MSEDLLYISLVQPDMIWENKIENLNRYGQLLTTMKGKSDLIILPEMFSTGFTMNPASLAEKMDGSTVDWMKNVSKKMKASIAGSVIIEEDDRYYNRLIICDPSGNLNWYDKRHLFRMAGEEEIYSSGKDRLVIQLQKWRICFQICYDLRFPVWSRNRNDYDILVYVSNWPEARKDIWDILLKARAIENQCYAVGVNRVGTDGNGISYSGGSMIVNPKGVPACILEENKETVVTCSVSLPELQAFRDKFPAWKDRDAFKITELPTRNTEY
jgi:predicted amidohydrolase